MNSPPLAPLLYNEADTLLLLTWAAQTAANPGVQFKMIHLFLKEGWEGVSLYLGVKYLYLDFVRVKPDVMPEF